MYTANDVKSLRDKTGAGMLDCKKALEESKGDIDKAIDWLREKGISKALKKESRIAAEGITTYLIKGNKAVILEINSETDFVAKNEEFQQFVKELVEVIIDSNVQDLEEALILPMNDSTVKDTIVALTAKVGEKINFRRF